MLLFYVCVIFVVRYRSYRNLVNRELVKAKKKYYAAQVNNIKDMKQVWAKCDEMAGRNSTFSEPITVIKDGIELNDPLLIAEAFNDFYQDKVRKIVESLPQGPKPTVKKPPPLMSASTSTMWVLNK